MCSGRTLTRHQVILVGCIFVAAGPLVPIAPRSLAVGLFPKRGSRIRPNVLVDCVWVTTRPLVVVLRRVIVSLGITHRRLLGVWNPKPAGSVPANPDSARNALGCNVALRVINGDRIRIRWEPVTGPPENFPQTSITIVGYQVIVESFQVTLPPSSTQVILPRKFVQSLAPGEHEFEVLAIEARGNQTITEGSFTIQ
jgi:hypothetical protein